MNEVCRIQCERLEFKAARKTQGPVKTRHQSRFIVLRTYFHMVFWRQTVPNTSPLPGGAYSKSVPTDYLNKGHSRFCHPASALQSTSKHFVGVHFAFLQKGSACPGRAETKNLTRSRQQQRCFSSSAVRASGTRLDGSRKIPGCAFHHERAPAALELRTGYWMCDGVEKIAKFVVDHPS